MAKAGGISYFLTADYPDFTDFRWQTKSRHAVKRDG